MVLRAGDSSASLRMTEKGARNDRKWVLRMAEKRAQGDREGVLWMATGARGMSVSGSSATLGMTEREFVGS